MEPNQQPQDPNKQNSLEQEPATSAFSTTESTSESTPTGVPSVEAPAVTEPESQPSVAQPSVDAPASSTDTTTPVASAPTLTPAEPAKKSNKLLVVAGVVVLVALVVAIGVMLTM